MNNGNGNNDNRNNNGENNGNNGNGNGNNGNGNGNNDWNWWGVAAGAAAVVGAGLYAWSRSSTATSPIPQPSATSQEEQKQRSKSSFTLSNLSSILDRVHESSRNPSPIDEAISANAVPSRPHITNLNSLLQDIHNRYVALKKEEFEHHYRVFNEVFRELHKNMKEVDEYFNKYSSDVKFAGSHYDNLRITKPDEFDMDIVIGLPVNMSPDPFNLKESDIVIEQNYPGYVQLRAGTQYQNILIRDGVDCLVNRTAHSWMDDRNYILRSKFVSWFKGVGTKALNRFPRFGSTPIFYVDGTAYKIRTTESGPAWTIIIEAAGFRLDVDLVPAFKFPESRWPVGQNYRPIPEDCRRGYWMVVPKPNKNGNSIHDEHRSWRIALQDQEKQLFNNTYALRSTIRLIKKLRDTLGMKAIASYYIKTIFFHEIMELKMTNPDFWMRSDIATLFKYMLKRFHDALAQRKIPYFWNRNHNLIAHVDQSVINGYKSKVSKLLSVLESPGDYKEVAKYLLTCDEYSEYRHFLYSTSVY